VKSKHLALVDKPPPEDEQMTETEAIKVLLKLLHEAYDLLDAKQIELAKREHPMIVRMRALTAVHRMLVARRSCSTQVADRFLLIQAIWTIEKEVNREWVAIEALQNGNRVRIDTDLNIDDLPIALVSPLT
jgi:hypothetical protein